MSVILYDLSPLNELVDGNDAHKTMLIELFVEITPEISNDIKESYAKKDLPEVYAHTHKLKPTLQTMGINTARALVENILESCKRKEDSMMLAENIEKLCEILDKVILQLKEKELN